jgi:hypothetical protein
MYIIYGLVALAIFAVLGYLTSGNNTSVTADASAQSARGVAVRLVTMMGTAKTGFDSMLADGWAQTEVLFNGAPQFTCTAGANACPQAFIASGAAGFTQQVFHPTAGKVTPAPVATTDMVTGTDVAFRYGRWQVQAGTGGTATDLGTAAGDIVMWLPGVRQAVCQQVNAVMYRDAIAAAAPFAYAGADAATAITDVTNTVMNQTTANTHTYPGTATAIDVSPAGTPRVAGCFGSSDTNYTAYQVLAIN